jgi:hypothetical protein
MRYVDFRDSVGRELSKSSTGLTWEELKKRLKLPYERACPEWVKRMEKEIRLKRVKSAKGRAFVWRTDR